MSNRDDDRTTQWNSLGPGFHLKTMPFYSWLDHEVRSNSLLSEIIKRLFCWIWKCFYVLGYLFFGYHKRHSIIQNLFWKLSIFKTEHSSSETGDCQSHKTFSVTPVFTASVLLLLFELIKLCQCCGFPIINYFFSLTATNACATSWVTFFHFFDLIFP